jgi:hypothetical protein
MRCLVDRRTFLAAGLLPLIPTIAYAAPKTKWRAGVATRAITPSTSLWMAGYAARVKPSEGAVHDLHVKALALDDGSGRPAVLVTADILGFPASLARAIAKEALQRHGVSRNRLILNASHTHSGPVIGDTIRIAYDMTPKQWQDVAAYTKELEGKVVECIGAALKDLKPATLRFGKSRAGFAANRRTGFQPLGPVDQEVPLLRVDGADGAPRAVVFSYACHNTTLGGDMVMFHGDYAGVAQEQIEKSAPGLTALYMAGCGGDANPAPRGALEHVLRHGEELAKAVHEGLNGSLTAVNGPLRAAWAEVNLPFAPFPDRAGWTERLKHPDRYVAANARHMLALLDADGRIPAEYPYPVQVWRFGKNVTLIPMAGEVVVDYTLRFKRELGAEKTWVVGYSNDVFAYVPSTRVLKEGGYEGAGAMIYYGLPGPFAESVEETIVRKVHELVRKTDG